MNKNDDHGRFLEEARCLEEMEHHYHIDKAIQELNKSKVELVTVNGDVYRGVLDISKDGAIIKTCNGNYIIMTANTRSIRPA